MNKTLGGDRLGSGKKMKVEIHGYERSTHDKGYIVRTTMAAGTLVPFINEVSLPGDTWDIHLDTIIKTHPTIGPLFGSYKVQLDIFLAPIRLYIAKLHNNMLGVGRNMSTVQLPQIELTSTVVDITDENIDADNSQINPSSILAHLGLRGVGLAAEPTIRSFNAISILMYWDCYKNYYANKQEEIGAVIHTPSQAIIDTITEIEIFTPLGASAGVLPEDPGAAFILVQKDYYIVITWAVTKPLPEQVIARISPGGQANLTNLFLTFTDLSATELIATFNHDRWGDIRLVNYRMQEVTDQNNGLPSVVTFPLSNIDDMRMALLQEVNQFKLNDTILTPYSYLWGQPAGVPNLLSSQEGLGLKTYQSDLFNNWISTEWLDGTGGINEITRIDTSGGFFNIDALLIGRKLYDLLNRVVVSGGSYNDWQDAVWAHERYRQCESPMYMGGLIKELVFQEVVSNSESQSDNGNQPLGTLAGKGVMGNKHKGGTVVIKVDEPSYILGIISLTPRVDYSQGNQWDFHLQTMDDLHKPALDQIGFQELITEQMAWWDTELVGPDWIQKSAGKQPAWLNYMTNVNRTRGNFAITENEMFMTLNRRYEPGTAGNSNIQDLTTYIDPSKFNFIFAQTALDSQNFWAQIAVDITVRRKMSAKIMPNL